MKLTLGLRKVLEPNLAPHFQVASLSNGHLVLTSPSAAWATRLRLQSGGLVNILAQQVVEFQGIKTLEIKILPRRDETPKHQAEPRKISQRAASDLTAMAETFSDGALKDALLRLAERANDPQSK